MASRGDAQLVTCISGGLSGIFDRPLFLVAQSVDLTPAASLFVPGATRSQSGRWVALLKFVQQSSLWQAFMSFSTNTIGVPLHSCAIIEPKKYT